MQTKITAILLSAVLLLCSFSGCADDIANDMIKNRTDDGIVSETTLSDTEKYDFNGLFIPVSDYDGWGEKYAPVLDCWQTAINERFGSDMTVFGHIYDNSYPYFSSLNIIDWLTADIYCAYYDVNADGTAELLIAGASRISDDRSGYCYGYDVFEIYTLDGGEPVRFLADFSDRGYDRQRNRLELDADFCGKYTDFSHWFQLSLRLEWRLLSPSAVSMISEDYLEGYIPLDCPIPEYNDIIDILRRNIWVYDAVKSKGYHDYINDEIFMRDDIVRLNEEYPGNGLIDACWSYQPGYALYDINSDGTDELIIMDISSLSKRNILDIFTLCGPEPKHILVPYKGRIRFTAISRDGRIYVNRVYSVPDLMNAGRDGFLKYETTNYIFTIEPDGLISHEAVRYYDDEYTYLSRGSYDPGEGAPDDEEAVTLSGDRGAVQMERFSGENIDGSIIDSLEFVPFFRDRMSAAA